MKSSNGDGGCTIPKVLSLNQYSVRLPDELSCYLESQYLVLYDGDAERARDHFKRILEKMKSPPNVTTCRINQIQTTAEEFLCDVRKVLETESVFLANRHEFFADVIEIKIMELYSHMKTLCNSTGPPEYRHDDTGRYVVRKNNNHDCWPREHKVIICDIFCGEAVLRGSNIFKKGIMFADRGVTRGDEVAVYANIKHDKTLTRGMFVDQYTGLCIFLGIGIARCSRAQMFTSNNGIGVEMRTIPTKSKYSNSPEYFAKAVIPQPSMNDKLVGKMMLQNLPSVLVATALDPQKSDIIADLCAAPGGKTSHLASLVNNEAIIIAMDRSRKKVASMQALFETMGASCISPIPMDSTKCLLPSKLGGRSVQDILFEAKRSIKDNLMEIEGFYAESFDRILLDPPCSALGLRPKLNIPFQNQNELKRHSEYAKRFIRNAVGLLKVGGTLTYSTCTINAGENEEIVRYILDEFPCMKLLPIEYKVGAMGLPGFGLNDEERGMVRRFDPGGLEDTMGFFVAKFVKGT